MRFYLRKVLNVFVYIFKLLYREAYFILTLVSLYFELYIFAIVCAMLAIADEIRIGLKGETK